MALEGVWIDKMTLRQKVLIASALAVLPFAGHAYLSRYLPTLNPWIDAFLLALVFVLSSTSSFLWFSVFRELSSSDGICIL